jgi:hypothetical protein
MSTLEFTLCVPLAVMLFWAGLRFIVFREHKFEVFIGLLMIYAAFEIVVILCLAWPPF